MWREIFGVWREGMTQGYDAGPNQATPIQYVSTIIFTKFYNKSTDVHVVLYTSKISMIFCLWIDMDSNCFPYICKDFPLIPLDFHRFHGLPHISWFLKDVQWISNNSFGFPWIPMDMQIFLWASIDFYGIPWISVDLEWISEFLDFHYDRQNACGQTIEQS